MAYDKLKIFEQAKELIEKNKLFFVEDIVALLPVAKPTFYDFFPPDSNELNTIKEMLDKNRVEIKSSMLLVSMSLRVALGTTMLSQ